MITTEGFRDILHIARHKKPLNFSLQQELPWQSRPLVKRRHRLTVNERVTVADGEVLVPLDEDEVRERVRALRERRRRGRRRLPAPLVPQPGARAARSRRSCSRSSPRPTCPSRTRCCRSTASSSASRPSCLNAYVGPKVVALRRPLRRGDARRRASTHGVQLMQSSGGMATVESAAQRPGQPAHVRAGGRPDRRHLGRADGGLRERRHARHRRHLGRHRRRRRRPAAHAPPARHEDRRLPGDGADGRHRHDRRRRRLDRVRRPGRRLPRRPAVGRRRSRARPATGAAATQPTSTDAQLVLGRLRSDRGLLGGAMRLDRELAEKAMQHDRRRARDDASRRRRSARCRSRSSG